MDSWRDAKLTFGKHKGETLQHILEKDPGYIVWLHDKKIVHNLPSILIMVARESIKDLEPDIEDLHSDWGDRD